MSRDNPRGKGQGAVYQRASDGYYCSALELPPRNGVRRRKVVTQNPKGLTHKQAEAAVIKKLNAEKAKLERNGDLPSADQSLASWLDVWYRTIAVKKIRPKTAAVYRTMLEQYIIPEIGDVRLDKLTPAHVRRVETLIIGKGRSSTTAAQAHRVLAVALKYAEREGRIARNVANLTDAPRRASVVRETLTAADGIKILRTTFEDRLGSRTAAALLTGARQGELLGLEIDRVSDVLDLSWQLQRLTWEHGCKAPCGAARGAECPDRTITAPADWEHRYLTGGMWLSRPKSQAGWRIIPLVEPLRSMINRRIEAAANEANPFGLVWTSDPKMVRGRRTFYPLDGSPIDPSTDNHAWHDNLTRAGVPQVRLHDARRVTASLLLAARVPMAVIVRILGHSTFAMSQQYMNVDRDQMDSAMTAIASQLGLSPLSGVTEPGAVDNSL